MQRALKNKDDARLRELHERLSMAEALHAACPSADTSEERDSAKADLQAMHDSFNIWREQAKFDRDITGGERGSTEFFRHPSTPSYRVSIPNVQLPNGSLTADPDEMAAEHRTYWGNLYQTPSRDLRETQQSHRHDPGGLQTLLEHTTSRLTDDQRRLVDAPITANDLYWAIRKSPKGKSAGYDGLTAEYYQLFPSSWACVYELVYACNFDHGRMTKFQRRAYISLLHKGGDRALPSNYRPITLLNHDAKFGPKILAWRLRDIDQTGFVQGRSIRHALLRFQDLQSLAQQEGLPQAGAVLLDFAKAFDSVLWPALDLVLNHFGFGEVFRAWVSTFFRGTLVSVLVNGTASKFFELGCGVRQGDPLSPALFVLFVEPMLCYLRATTSATGMKVPGDDEPHHLLAFADDCTGLLRDLQDAPTFINQVKQYSATAGMRLNVKKTHLLPFRPLPPETRRSLESYGWDVVADDGAARLLGIYISPSLSTGTRFSRLISAMVARCTLWKYRARTLLGRAVILRTIILPLLWFTAAVTKVLDSVVAQVECVSKSFLFKLPISADTHVRGPMPREWLYMPLSKGGLDLPATTQFAQALQLCSLRDAMSSATENHKVPRWFLPALALFDHALRGVGVGFDILYAPIPKTLTLSLRWKGLSTFWIGPLRTWNVLVDSFCIAADLLWAQPEQPYWHNRYVRVGRGARLADTASRNSSRYYTLGYLRMQDFVDRHGSYPTASLCRSILADQDFSEPRLLTLAANHFIRQVTDTLDLSQGPLEGPHLPTAHDFYHLLRPLPNVKSPSHTALGVETAPDWSNLWRREKSLDRDILPILADLKFRLQHNALNVRAKYHWHTEDVNCVHGCGVVETAGHLFWECSLAQEAWGFFLPSLRPLMNSDLQWPGVAYLQNLNFSTVSMARYRIHNLIRVFNVIRCSVLYLLWLHRNDRLFQGVSSNAEFVRHRANAYLKLHLRRMVSEENVRLSSLCHRWIPEEPPSDESQPQGPQPPADRSV